MANDNGFNNSDTLTSFNRVIEIVFNNWTALKIAIEHGMGGQPAVAANKVKAMVDTACQALASGTSDWISLSDCLAETMDTQFHTELEDDSSDEMAKHLLHLFQLFRNGSIEDLTAAISFLPNQTPITVGPSVPSFQPQIAIEEQEDEDSEVPQNDGWTIVKRK